MSMNTCVSTWIVPAPDMSSITSSGVRNTPARFEALAATIAPA